MSQRIHEHPAVSVVRPELQLAVLGFAAFVTSFGAHVVTVNLPRFLELPRTPAKVPAARPIVPGPRGGCPLHRVRRHGRRTLPTGARTGFRGLQRHQGRGLCAEPDHRRRDRIVEFLDGLRRVLRGRLSCAPGRRSAPISTRRPIPEYAGVLRLQGACKGVCRTGSVLAGRNRTPVGSATGL